MLYIKNGRILFIYKFGWLLSLCRFEWGLYSFNWMSDLSLVSSVDLQHSMYMHDIPSFLWITNSAINELATIQCFWWDKKFLLVWLECLILSTSLVQLGLLRWLCLVSCSKRDRVFLTCFLVGCPTVAWHSWLLLLYLRLKTDLLLVQAHWSAICGV